MLTSPVYEDCNANPFQPSVCGSSGLALLVKVNSTIPNIQRPPRKYCPGVEPTSPWLLSWETVHLSSAYAAVCNFVPNNILLLVFVCGVAQHVMEVKGNVHSKIPKFITPFAKTQNKPRTCVT